MASDTVPGHGVLMAGEAGTGIVLGQIMVFVKKGMIMAGGSLLMAAYTGVFCMTGVAFIVIRFDMFPMFL